jgi:hypothetical protein
MYQDGNNVMTWLTWLPRWMMLEAQADMSTSELLAGVVFLAWMVQRPKLMTELGCMVMPDIVAAGCHHVAWMPVVPGNGPGSVD